MASKFLTGLIINAIKIKGTANVHTLMKNCKNANQLSHDLLMSIVRDNKDTEYGKKYHFDEIHSIEDFKKNVPLSTFDDYAPYIERMVEKGEKNLLTTYKIVQYAETSGSVGVPKKIPVTDKSMKIYTKYTISRVTKLADQWLKKNRGHGLKIGRGFNQLEIVDRCLPDGTPLGNISGSAAKSYKALFPYYLTSPIPVLYPEGYMPMMYLKIFYALKERDMSFMFSVFMSNLVDMMVYIEQNWESLCQDIRTGTFNESVQIDEETKEKLAPYTKPDPARADELEAEFRKGFDTPIIPRIWKQMSFICTIGTGGFAAYTERMRSYSGDVPIDFSIYGASEAMMAACTEVESPEFALLNDSCFFEFIPADAPAGTTETLTIDQLEVGKEYEIIITNLSGFYRYCIKDVVRVLGYEGESPKITFAYRKSQLLDIAGDKITEEMMDKTVAEFGKRIGTHITDYCVFINRDVSPAHYEFLVEPDKEMDVSKCDEYREILEDILGEINPVYKECKDTNEIAPAILYLQQPQTHALWREFKMMKGASANQVKPVRVLDTPMKKGFFYKLIQE